MKNEFSVSLFPIQVRFSATAPPLVSQHYFHFFNRLNAAIMQFVML